MQSAYEQFRNALRLNCTRCVFLGLGCRTRRAPTMPQLGGPSKRVRAVGRAKRAADLCFGPHCTYLGAAGGARSVHSSILR